jgi:regulator of extracellular matrix RemA (YlzA/DUF370 family)
MRIKSLLINIGHTNVVAAHEVVSILNPNSAPIVRLRNEARKVLRLVDACHGQKARSLLIMSSGFLILSPVDVESLTKRFNEAFECEPRNEV